MIGLSIHYVRFTHVDTCRPFIPIATYCSIAQIYYALFTHLMDNFPAVLMLFSLNNHKEARRGKRSHSPCRMDKLLSVRLDSNKERPLKCGSAWVSGAKTATFSLPLEQEAAAFSARRREKMRQGPACFHTHIPSTHSLWNAPCPCSVGLSAPHVCHGPRLPSLPPCSRLGAWHTVGTQLNNSDGCLSE